MSDAYLRADAERLGEQIWTDGQVHAYLAEMDRQLAQGIGEKAPLDFEFAIQAGRFEWMDMEYRLTYGGDKIRLTLAQARIVEDWVQAHKHPRKEASDRDNHFAGFAELLWEELHTLYLAQTVLQTDPEHEEA